MTCSIGSKQVAIKQSMSATSRSLPRLCKLKKWNWPAWSLKMPAGKMRQSIHPTNPMKNGSTPPGAIQLVWVPVMMLWRLLMQLMVGCFCTMQNRAVVLFLRAHSSGAIFLISRHSSLQRPMVLGWPRATPIRCWVRQLSPLPPLSILHRSQMMPVQWIPNSMDDFSFFRACWMQSSWRVLRRNCWYLA